jgi:hypothetical protein
MRRPSDRSRSAAEVGRVAGFRSGLEDKIAASLKARGVAVGYECMTLEYTLPEKVRRYTPDWRLPNGVIVESKGRFVTADRQKMLAVKAQHPHLDIRFVFSNSNARISKQSSTTYAMWCERHGFPFADRDIPDHWLKEPSK